MKICPAKPGAARAGAAGAARAGAAGAARAGAAIAAIAAASAAAAVDQPNPGLYEVTTQMVYGDLPIPPTSITTNQCVTDEALQESLSQALAIVPLALNCEIVEFNVGGGNIAMQLSCAAAEGSIVVKTTGNYTENAYAMKSHIANTGGGTAMDISGDISGKRIGDC
jgi:hypothetical protein